MLAPSQLTWTTWPIPGDDPDLTVIVRAQAVTIHDQEALLHAYQGVLDSAQTLIAATATGTGTGTSLVVTAVVNVIFIGATVSGTGVPAGTTIVAQQSGTAGAAGTYTTSQTTTATSAALVFSPPPYTTTWPPVSAATDLMATQQAQNAVLKSQSALLQQYQDLLNASQTPPPATGP
jgi:hypothetical protein